MLQSQQPMGQGLRVVLSQRFQISDLEARSLRGGDHHPHRKQLAVGEDVALDEAPAATAAHPRDGLSRRNARDRMIEKQTAGSKQPEHAGEVFVEALATYVLH